MGKWIKASKIGLWFYGQTQTKNWFTSKTFWNSASQKIGVLAVIIFGLEPGLSEQLVAVLVGASAFGIDLWVRHNTSAAMGSTLRTGDADTEISDDYESDENYGD